MAWASSYAAGYLGHKAFLRKKKKGKRVLSCLLKRTPCPRSLPVPALGLAFCPNCPCPSARAIWPDAFSAHVCRSHPHFTPPPTKLGLGICVLISAVTLAGMLYEKGIFPQGAPKYWEDTKGWLSAMVFATRPLPKPQSRKAQRGASAASSILAKRTAFLRTMEEGIS